MLYRALIFGLVAALLIPMQPATAGTHGGGEAPTAGDGNDNGGTNGGDKGNANGSANSTGGANSANASNSNGGDVANTATTPEKFGEALETAQKEMGKLQEELKTVFKEAKENSDSLTSERYEKYKKELEDKIKTWSDLTKKADELGGVKDTDREAISAMEKQTTRLLHHLEEVRHRPNDVTEQQWAKLNDLLQTPPRGPLGEPGSSGKPGPPGGEEAAVRKPGPPPGEETASPKPAPGPADGLVSENKSAPPDGFEAGTSRPSPGRGVWDSLSDTEIGQKVSDIYHSARDAGADFLSSITGGLSDQIAHALSPSSQASNAPVAPRPNEIEVLPPPRPADSSTTVNNNTNVTPPSNAPNGSTTASTTQPSTSAGSDSGSSTGSSSATPSANANGAVGGGMLGRLANAAISSAKNLATSQTSTDGAQQTAPGTTPVGIGNNTTPTGTARTASASPGTATTTAAGTTAKPAGVSDTGDVDSTPVSTVGFAPPPLLARTVDTSSAPSTTSGSSTGSSPSYPLSTAVTNGSFTAPRSAVDTSPSSSFFNPTTNAETAAGGPHPTGGTAITAAASASALAAATSAQLLANTMASATGLPPGSSSVGVLAPTDVRSLRAESSYGAPTFPVAYVPTSFSAPAPTSNNPETSSSGNFGGGSSSSSSSGGSTASAPQTITTTSGSPSTETVSTSSVRAPLLELASSVGLGGLTRSPASEDGDGGGSRWDKLLTNGESLLSPVSASGSTLTENSGDTASLGSSGERGVTGLLVNSPSPETRGPSLVSPTSLTFALKDIPQAYNAGKLLDVLRGSSSSSPTVKTDAKDTQVVKKTTGVTEALEDVDEADAQSPDGKDALTPDGKKKKKLAPGSKGLPPATPARDRIASIF